MCALRASLRWLPQGRCSRALFLAWSIAFVTSWWELERSGLLSTFTDLPLTDFALHWKPQAISPAQPPAPAPLLWIPSGRQYTFEDLVFWSGKLPGQHFQEVAARIDTVVSGPHASAAFPAELRPFVSPTLTLRKQCDFSDVATGHLGRAWAQADPGVVFVQNPHARVVLDPNRDHYRMEPKASLKDFFARLRRIRAGERGVKLGGIDAIRPITFSGEDVLLEPSATQGVWGNLTAALKAAAALGPLVYEAALEKVLHAVLAARPRGSLTFIALHDTNDFKMRPDGALLVQRPEKDRMPSFVNLGNLGDDVGNGDGVSTPGPVMRSIAKEWAKAFGLKGDQDFLKPAQHAHQEDISFNRPYPGGYELRKWHGRLHAHCRSRCFLFQVEFNRKALLGRSALRALEAPGSDWPPVDTSRVAELARSLRAAADALRATTFAVAA